MAMDGGGSFGVPSFPSAGQSVTHVPPSLGAEGMVADSERGIGGNVKGHGPHHGRQGAPDHGPMPDHFDRGERKAY